MSIINDLLYMYIIYILTLIHLFKTVVKEPIIQPIPLPPPRMSLSECQ